MSLENKSERGLTSLKQKENLTQLTDEIHKGIDSLLADEEKEIPVVPIKNRNFKAFMIAASIGFIVAFSTVFLFNNNNKPEKLYSAYFDAYPDVISETLRSENNTANVFTKAMDAYNAGDYSEAISNFKDLSGNTSIQFYEAISYLGNGEAQNAIDILAKLPANSDLEDGRQWYTALAYLKLSDTSKAKTLLSTIANSKHYKSTDAAEILEKLE